MIPRRSFVCFHRPRQTLKTLFTFPNPFQSDSISYSKQKVLRYTPEQVFNVVADVDSYKYFLPWCRDSRVYDRKGTKAKGLMIVGFPPFVERYTSDMTLIKPSLVRSIASGDKLFKELITEWKMSAVEEKCVVDFNISFQFRSSLHSKVATVFFDEVARTMVGAFERRCADLYGFRPISKKNLTPQK
ncbi:coenzyme Q-binding protein COQ10 homolog A, mitochondrial-like [Oscarella lobularis]|uniref:coenzyme Q-binding protein COQ10 homolog A, mitochondrial-like n=1 Tax=Oscarella lobularis TaxID=121494 RepID=UPI0033138839